MICIDLLLSPYAFSECALNLNPHIDHVLRKHRYLPILRRSSMYVPPSTASLATRSCLLFCDFTITIINIPRLNNDFLLKVIVSSTPPVRLFHARVTLPAFTSVYFQWLCLTHSGCIIIRVIPCPHTQIPEHYRPRSLSGSHQVMTLCVCCVAWHVAMTSFLMNDPFANIQPHTICCDTPQSVPS